MNSGCPLYITKKLQKHIIDFFNINFLYLWGKNPILKDDRYVLPFFRFVVIRQWNYFIEK